MEPINAQDELAFIKKVIQDSRMAVVDNGIEFIVWGVLVSLGMFGTFVLDRLRATDWAGGSWIYLVLWVGIMGSGWAFSLIRHLRQRRRDRTETPAGRLLGGIWLSCGIAIMIFIFIHGPARQVDPCLPIAAVLGIGFFLSGMLMDFQLMRWSGVCWWVGSVALLFFRSVPLEMLVFGCMMLTFQVLPGVILYRKWRTAQAGS